MKVLFLEDEPKVVSLVKRGLEGEGIEFAVAMDGFTAVKMAGLNQYDLIILDVMVPGMSGLEVCKSIRDADPDTPILILSALGSTQDIVAGFNNLADDYMVKPFNLAELRARMQSLVRRSGRSMVQQNVMTIADLSVNLDTMEVTRNNKVIALTVREFKLLEYLIKNKRKVLPRLDILEHVWGADFDMGTNVVDVYINYLRKKIDKDFSPRLIHTVVGIGYVMRTQ
ncbi:MULTISPECIES: response regulator transcription factor [Pontibacter]|uniref:DNA-binding response regulator, OmpR family, contains REC and winged-helix (WHTH) domain n=1 Tax=Pontibacter lucknowensis TaxID=1077936 RepID=A0A1N7A8B1_9BACT|nr:MULTISPECIES: response regulator transcription factor [Pontibacter]EJF11271.1 response regulator receiver [Pontibacter sp. BAB1700]SIR35213.1 DNA-binding response regulator, OmpR family, contains REC and winged-helix (wHTH) domain [Pontibacter lucknowensis]